MLSRSKLSYNVLSLYVCCGARNHNLSVKRNKTKKTQYLNQSPKPTIEYNECYVMALNTKNMKANTYIRFKNETPKRVKEDVNIISELIHSNNQNSFHFIEITEIVSYTSGAEFEEKTEYNEEKSFINIKFITSYQAIT